MLTRLSARFKQTSAMNELTRKAFKYLSIDQKRARLYDLSPDKNKRGLCAVRYCRNTKLRGRRTCSRCKHRRREINDPIGFAFAVVQTNARRRGKEFTITKEYFAELCEKSGYLTGKGRRANALSLDRINPTFGYIEGNIRVIEFAVNSSRCLDDYDHDPENDLPF